MGLKDRLGLAPYLRAEDIDKANHEIELGRTESGRRWVVRCKCGWAPQSTRATKEEALKTGVWHLYAPARERKAAADLAKRNGVSTTLSHPPNTVIPGVE